MTKLFLTDVDGCLTDGAMFYSADGDELKRFCVYDGMGMTLLRQAGIPCGILTSENTPIVLNRARKLHLDYLFMGVGSRVGLSVSRYSFATTEAAPISLPAMTKLDAARLICDELGITLADVCFVGDDINDIDLLRAVGLPCCPPNARPEVKALTRANGSNTDITVLATPGGQGAIREIADRILAHTRPADE